MRRSAVLLLPLALLWLGAQPAPESPPARAQEQAGPAADRPMLLETEASERLLQKARQELFNFRMDAAGRTLGRLAARPDGAAAALHHRALMALLKGLVSDETKYFDEFFEHSDALDDRLDDAPEGRWRDYLYAEMALQRVIARAKTGSYMKAAWGARSAFGRYEDLNEEAPGFYDAQMGLGLLHVVVGSLPGGWRRMLGFLGFDGTVEGGRTELERAATESRYHRLPASLMLALVDMSIYRETERARERLSRLHQQNPKSLIVAHLYGVALLSNQQAAEAERVLRQATTRGIEEDYFYVSYLDYYLARALFRQDDFAGAERYYRRYIARHHGPALKASAYLSLGEAVEMQGRRAEAVRYYQQIESGRDFDSDRVATRRAEHLLEAPMTARERLLMRGRNAYDAGRYARADSLLTQVFNDPGATDAERAEAAYRRGRVFHAQQRWGEAVRAYRYAVAHPGDEKAKWAPWSQLYLGKIYAAQGRKEPARRAYEKALEYEDFDYAQSLEQVARAELESLDAEAQ